MAESIAPLRVRAGIHVGAVEKREDDYYGPALNRVARLMSAGQGGQTLLSRAARELVGRESSFVDLGEHRLRDLLEPERIFQHGATEFAPLRTLDVKRHNLPVQVTPFIGREDELREIGDLLGQSRLLTLVGPGGTGKTRLAIEVAAEELDSFESVYFVDLTNAQVPTPLFGIADTMRTSLTRMEGEIAGVAAANSSPIISATM